MLNKIFSANETSDAFNLEWTVLELPVNEIYQKLKYSQYSGQGEVSLRLKKCIVKHSEHSLQPQFICYNSGLWEHFGDHDDVILQVSLALTNILLGKTSLDFVYVGKILNLQ